MRKLNHIRNIEEELDPTGKRLARSILWVQMKSKTGSSKKE